MIAPVVRDLVLLGGGHTHVIVIRKWAMQPIAGVRLTLVSTDALTPYSGMLPGLVAGHYTVEQSHIDLTRLCRWAGVRFIEEEAASIDPERNRINFSGRPALEYDTLSIDTGGAPRLDNVKGASMHTVPVKPVHRFFEHWLKIEAKAVASRDGLDIGVVGAGAGGFEILLAMHQKLMGHRTSPGSAQHRFHWIIRDQPLAGYPGRVGQMALDACAEKGINCHHGFDVVEVGDGILHSDKGEHVKLDDVLWCTEAMAPSWPASSGLQCDRGGFIEVNDSLQSLSHPNVFAAGDVAIQVNHPRPRAGVFAVRQGPVLFSNLQRVVTDQALECYRPQDEFLTLLSMGSKSAIGNKGVFSVKGKWVWRWKNWIDLRFMARFNDLPAMPVSKFGELSPKFAQELNQRASDYKTRCGGCGAKIPWDIVNHTLSQLKLNQHPDQITGVRERGDVAMIKPSSPLLAQSVDQIRGFVEDPWLFARIATLHGLSDLYAVNAIPQSAMLLVNLPFAHDTIMRRDIEQLLAGVVFELNRADCELSGGHTSEAAELSLGIVVNGNAKEQQSAIGKEALVGYKILTTKPLGVGVVMAADMRALSTGTVVHEALQSMLLSNERAAQVFAQHQSAAVTDITGFGIVGHLAGLLSEHKVGCEIDLDKIPILSGALLLSRSGITSSLFQGNVRAWDHIVTSRAGSNSPAYPILFDPQTSGGLIALVPDNNANACVEQLQKNGYARACVIGTVTAVDDDQPPIRLNGDQ